LKEYKELLAAAELPKIRFHDLRHTAACLMLNRGPILDVSRILGHSKPRTTTDIYGHLIPVMRDDIGNRIDEWLKPVEGDTGKVKKRQEMVDFKLHQNCAT